MAFEHEKRNAAHLLALLEDGGRPADDIRMFYEEVDDPALIALILGWLRTKYHPGHSAAEGVLGRIIALLQASPKVARMAKEGAKDPIVTWFEETWTYGELDRVTFIDEVVEKLEG